MKILITGFDPFGGEEKNAALEAVQKLPDCILGATVIKKEIPTIYWEGAKALEREIEVHRPDVVICVGQAGGRTTIDMERVAINLAESSMKDNAGNQPVDAPLVEGGENAYFAKLPIKEMVAYIQEKGIPAGISYSAGTFVCNDVMYHLLYLIQQKYPQMLGGFIHVPYTMDQVVGKVRGTACLPLEVIAKGLEYAVEAIVNSCEC